MSFDQAQVKPEHHPHEHGGLISILQDIQARYGYLPKEALQDVAQKTGRPLVDIYGVATFYKAFSLKPRGRHLISACLGTACHVRGGNVIAKEFEKQLGIKAGEMTPDRQFTLETVNCLGACAIGPVVVVDGHYFSNVTLSKVAEIIQKAREGVDHVDIQTDERIFPVEVSCARCNHSLMDDRQLIDGHPVIRVTVSCKDKYGWLALSCLWGSYNVTSEFEIPGDTVVHMFCPHCHTELIGATRCAECNASMVPMIIKGGGVIQICSRRGCRNHLIDLIGTTLA
jgi:NADH-quinone oxidoreductase subunit E